MSKKRIIDVAAELGTSVNELMQLKQDKLKPEHWTGVGKNTYFTEDAVELLRLALDVPLAVPNKVMATVLMEAKNPRWVYAKIDGKDGKTPIAIPRKLRGKLVGKRILVDAITDANNLTTYRHADLGN